MPDDVGVALEKWVGGRKAEDLRGLWSRLESSVFPHTSGPYPVKHEADHVGRVVVNLANLLEAIAREKVAPQFWDNLHILFAAALIHDVGMVCATIDAGEYLDEATKRHADLERIKTMLSQREMYSPVNNWDEYEHLCALAFSHATSINGDGTETTAETKTKELESRFGQLHPYIGHYSRLLQFADFLDIRRSRLNPLSPQQYRSEQYPHYRKHELLTARVDPKAMLISLEAGTPEKDGDKDIVIGVGIAFRLQFDAIQELLRYGWRLCLPELLDRDSEQAALAHPVAVEPPLRVDHVEPHKLSTRLSVENGSANPKVFISYSHDSEAHRKRVLALSERLRQDGIDADLDQYVNGTPDQGWPRWMEDGLDWADRVLVVCTETYHRRFRGHEDPGKGKGVDWEGAIITNELYASRSQTKKFVPVIYEAEDGRFVPRSLAGYTRYLLTSEDAYRQLYDALLGQSGVERGRLGALQRKARDKGEPAKFEPKREPTPQYRSSRVEEVSKRLQDLRRRKKEVQKQGANTEKLDAQIFEARRELRNGPIEAGWELSEERYQLLEELGHGGFATVWKAQDRERGELVAIKVIHSHLAGDPVRLERFFRGARIMAELDHPGIVKVLEPHGEDQGYHYFVMGLVEGGTLRKAVQTKRLSRDEAVDCVLQVGEALAAAHAKGCVHRDIKPANILLTMENDAKLSDFDLVGAGDTTGGTRTGALGSYAYAAPECMTRPQDANATADVYSLAMTIVFALTGVDPNPWTFKESLSRLPCDGAMKSVLRKATDFEPAKRHSNAGELVRALRKNQSGTKVVRPPRAIAFGDDDKSPYPYAEVEIANGVVTRLRWIPPGRFLMGSPKSEAERADDEQQHWVTITRGFWLEETACTQCEWEAVMGSNPSRFKNEPQSAQHPVENVSWNDCQEFLKRVNAATPGLELRLPTEAEWEYACRAGTQTPFSFGENITTDQVNHEGNYPHAGAAKGEYRKRTVSVRSLPPNNWGLYEMHGNVWEWCWDWYGYYRAKEQRDPAGPAVGQYRVLRGGGWSDDAWYCRSARRGRSLPDGRWVFLGVRLLAVQPVSSGGAE